MHGLVHFVINGAVSCDNDLTLIHVFSCLRFLASPAFKPKEE